MSRRREKISIKSVASDAGDSISGFSDQVKGSERGFERKGDDPVMEEQETRQRKQSISPFRSQEQRTAPDTQLLLLLLLKPLTTTPSSVHTLSLAFPLLAPTLLIIMGRENR